MEDGIAYKKLQSLLNKVNAVTVTWRHQNTVSPLALNELCKRQIEVEEWLKFGVRSE